MVDFANQMHGEIGKFTVAVTLSPEKLMAGNYCVGELSWESVRYGEDECNEVPNDRRGVYAFAICHEDGVLPPYGCVLYIGIAGHNSNRSLRQRYKEYLNAKKVCKRDRIARMIGTWHKVLRFYYAPVDDDMASENLQKLERQLNTALLPVFAEGDLDADVKRKRRAFR